MKTFRKLILIIAGAGALLWFLIRVIPKPSRASYPCQQAAFPMASAFVIWLLSLFSSGLLIQRIRHRIRTRKRAFSMGTVATLSLLLISVLVLNSQDVLWATQKNYVQSVFWDNSQKINALESNITSTFDAVAIVKADINQIDDIDYESIQTLVRQAIEMSGGLEDIISNGDQVILKPNLVVLPDQLNDQNKELSGMTTDWRVTRAVSEVVREINPDGKIYVVESSSEASTQAVFEYYNYTMDNLPDVDGIIPLEDSCGVFEDFDSPFLETIALDNEIRLYPDDRKPNNSAAFYMSRFYKNADVLISIPVLKNHQEAIITGGIKNVAIGGTPPNIYGMAENYFGKWTKIDHSQENLHKWIHDYYLCKPVEFTVVDGLQGYDHGPVGADGIELADQQHNMRLIIAGKNTLSVDAVCGYIMSLDPQQAPYMIYLDQEEADLGTIDSKFIRPLGVPIPDIREVFHHISQVTNSAIYTDYSAPEVSLSSAKLENQILKLSLEHDADLNKVEFVVNDRILNQVCVKDFDYMEISLEDISEEIETVSILASDRFFNAFKLDLDALSIIDYKPFALELLQNYPNPFTESTCITFALPQREDVRILLYDIRGQLVTSIFEGKADAGEHVIEFSGSDLPRGTYSCLLEYKGERRRISLVRM